MILLDIADLCVRHRSDAGEVRALDAVNLRVAAGERVAVVGESGAGKSSLVKAIIGLGSGHTTGTITVAGRSILDAGEVELETLRGETLGTLLQGEAFNPTRRLGEQIVEVVRERHGHAEARRRLPGLLERVELPEGLAERYPHEVSGGQLRRAALAAALAMKPRLLLLDEPTAGLDPTTAAAVTRMIHDAVDDATGLVVITHALGDAVKLAERIHVLYGGQVMETGPTAEVLRMPRHPYTRDLVASYPVMTSTRDLRPIRGIATRHREHEGCAFAERCAQAEPVCRIRRPDLLATDSRAVGCHFGGLRTVLACHRVGFRHRSGPFSRDTGFGIHDVSLEVRHGEALGIIGESGSGKSTLARILSGFQEPDTGTVGLGRSSLYGMRPTERAEVQLVQQDPWAALSPRWSVGQSLGEALRLRWPLEGQARQNSRDLLIAGLESVGLEDDVLSARPSELSGGVLQRICLVRALLARPRVLVADEPTSLLDASEQARLLITLRERQTELGLSLVLISHDVAVVRKVTDRVVVLAHGRVVEHGPTERVLNQPHHPATGALVTAAPHLL